MLAHLVVGLTVIVSATVLTSLHDLDPQACVAIYGTAVGLVGGIGAAINTLDSASKIPTRRAPRRSTDPTPPSEPEAP